MDQQQELIFRKALQSRNPHAVLNVSRAFHDLGEPMIADTLKRLAASLWKQYPHYGFGVDYVQLQQLLNAFGTTPPLVLDGKWGPKSATALKAFQTAYGLKASGNPDTDTLAALGLSGAPAVNVTPVTPATPAPSSNAGAGNMYAQAQQRLNSLGASPPLKVDGLWGPKSKSALMVFQKANGLTADGVLGEKSATALGIPYVPVKGSHATPGGKADVSAYAIAKNANAELGLTEAEIQYVISVARGEGFYGNGWNNPVSKLNATDRAFVEANGLTGLEGIGSNNWGAVQGTGDAGSFPHLDHDAKGKPYIGRYKKWSTPEKGYINTAKTVLSGLKRGTVGAQEIRAAINKGNLHDAVYAQRANGYFELAADKYLDAVIGNYNAISDVTGWPRLLSELGITPTVAVAAGGTGLIGIILIAAGVWFFGKKVL